MLRKPPQGWMLTPPIAVIIITIMAINIIINVIITMIRQSSLHYQRSAPIFVQCYSVTICAQNRNNKQINKRNNSYVGAHPLDVLVIIINCMDSFFLPTLVLLFPSPPQKSSLGPPCPSSSAKGAPSENVSVFNLSSASSVI